MDAATFEAGTAPVATSVGLDVVASCLMVQVRRSTGPCQMDRLIQIASPDREVVGTPAVVVGENFGYRRDEFEGARNGARRYEQPEAHSMDYDEAMIRHWVAL